MKGKGHLYISVVKSCIRIWACVFALCMKNINWLIAGLILAEVLGIFEEIFDDRE